MISTCIVTALALTVSQPPTVVPVPSHETRAAAAGWGTGTWMDQHEAINAMPDDCEINLVFLGDSITQSWGGCGRTVGAPARTILDEHFATRHPANFGISGDRTQHVLWRIDNGNFDGVQPAHIVLLIGTNNLAHDAAKDIATGIDAILNRLRTACPDTQILLCGIVRGRDRQDSLRLKAETVNELTQALVHDRDDVTYIDLPTHFYQDDGTADPDLLRGDFVHFTPNGYRAWATLIHQAIENPAP